MGVFAFQVGGSSAGVKTGLEGLSDLHTFYIAKSVTVDGAERGQVQKMPIRPIPHQPDLPHRADAVCQRDDSQRISAADDLWLERLRGECGWQLYTAALSGGAIVVKVQAGDAVRCFVLHAVASSVVIENVTNPGSAIKAGDTAKGLPIAL